MANDSEEKQPPAQAPQEKSSAEEPSEVTEIPSDLDWNLRAHPAVPSKPPQPPAPPPAKPAVPAAAAPPAAPPAKPAVPAPPAAPAAPAEAKPAASTPPAAPAAPAAPAPAAPAAPAAVAAPAAPAAPLAAAPSTPGAQAPPKPPAPAAAGTPPAKPAAPAAPAPPKPGPEPLDNDLVKRFKARFGDAIKEATTDRKQAILVIDAGRLLEIAQYSRDDEKFDFLTDLTAVDWPKREKRFDVVLNLYSFAKNERLRLKVHAAENEPVPSVTPVWEAANWLEREAYDMFGIRFEGHPNLKRILLPDEWQGHPLRKDYDILTQDTAWVRENLGIESGQ